MNIIADLQLHSKFSRAVSKEMTITNIAQWSKRKGIGLVATGDWTHPLWFREIETNLEELGNGLLRLKQTSLANENLDASSEFASPLFLLATEVSSIYSQGGKVRRVHTLVWVPTLEAARKINKELTKRGCNLLSDGRPIIGLSCINIAELVFAIEPRALVIPAHAWTPWFSVYGALGGFNSLDEAFGPFAKKIYAVETGLSSNPAMNWRIAELDQRTILSFSDAHSGPKLGREATVFQIKGEMISYQDIYDAIVAPSDKARIAYTIEFYPEEGKYHYSGHRNCNIRWGPDETTQKGTTCPVCGKPLTQGVMQRVEELAGRSEADLRLATVNYRLANGSQIKMTTSQAFPNRPPFVMLVPLQEIISEAIGSPVTSPKVQTPFAKLTDSFEGEFKVLMEAPIAEISKTVGENIAKGVDKVRRGDLVIDPGYDGVFGVVKLWKEGEKALVDKSKEQLSIF